MKQGTYSPTILEWMDKVMENRGKNAENLLYFCNKIQEHGEKIKDYNLLGFAQYYKGETYYSLNCVDGMFQNLICCVENLKRAGVHELEASAYNLLGIVSVNQGNAHFALNYYLSGLKICKQHQCLEILAMIEYNIGALYSKYHAYLQARNYFVNSHSFFCKDALKRGTGINAFYADISIASCYLEEDNQEKAQQYLKRAQTEPIGKMDELTQLYLWCFKARFYNHSSNQRKQDENIKKVTTSINERMPIMEIFDDLYLYCQMLLKIQYYEELKHTLTVLETITKQADILHLKKNILAIQIELYKRLGEEEKYFTYTAAFYELSQATERENQYVIKSIMGVQFSLEEARQHRQEIEQENQILQEKSEKDPLTELPNRFRLNHVAETSFQKAYAEQKPLGMEILDIDYFKEYNDNYGHQAGDKCLIQIAKLLQNLCAENDIFCARYGGDEFIIIYENCTLMEVFQLSKSLKKKMKKQSIPHTFAPVEGIVSISQGICVDTPSKGQKVWDYLHCADVMLYHVKEECRGEIALCDGLGNIQAQDEVKTI